MIRSGLLVFSGHHPHNKYPNTPTKSNNHFITTHSFPSSLPTTPHNPRYLPSLKMASTPPPSSNPPPTTTDSSSTSAADSEVLYDIPPVMKVYKSGRIERLAGEEVVPPSLDPTTNVESKDVVISEEHGISARLFLPKTGYPHTQKKLPLFFYAHGGAFCIETPFSPNYTNFLNNVTSKANAIGVSVHYRRAPEHPVPTAHEDSWLALKWVASHSGGNGPDEWLNRHADFEKVFFAGDSAGANIVHYLGIRVGKEGLPGLRIEGIVLLHPYFWGVERIGSESDKADKAEMAVKIHELWRIACPKTSGSDDPFINPEKDPDLGKVACGRMIVFVAEHDLLRDRGWYYKELLEKSGWGGTVEVLEAKDEHHVFHMFKPTCENALILLNQVVSFIKQD